MMQNRNGLPDAILEEKRFFELKGSGKTATPTGWNNPENWKYLDDIPEDKYFGFAIGNNSNYLLIDGDHVRDPVTGQLDPIAAEVCKRIDKIAPTYSEISMSGTGFHKIVDLGEYGDCFEPETNADIQKIVAMDPVKYANLPEAERDHTPKIELFYHARGRYVYLTGKHTNDAKPKQIARNEDAAAIFTELIRIREELHAKYSEGLQVSVNSSENKRQLDDATKERIMAALPFISARERETWVRIGIALSNCGFPFEVWNEWSQWDDQRKRIRCDKYDLKDAQKVWKSFRNCKSRWNEGTIFIEARKNGYYQSGMDNQNDDSKESGAGAADLEQFHLHNKKGEVTSVFDWAIYKYLSQKESLFVLGGIVYRYKAGVFRTDVSGSELSTMIRNLIYPQFRRAPTVKRIFELFTKSAELQVTMEDLNQYPAYWINFENGFYDPLKHQMIPHDPKYFSVNQLPHSFYPDADPSGEHICQWLERIADPDDLEMLLQYAGYCMTRDTRQQKFLILRGSGGTGKSTLIRLIEAVVGAENISNVSLSQLTQRFAAFGLLGKLVNSCADLEVASLRDTSIIKKVLGEDRISAESKGKDQIFFRNYSKLIFSTNELPVIEKEKTNGFYRRLLVLTMDRVPEHQDPDLFSGLVSEIDVFIHMCVAALERMLKAGCIHESKGSIEGVKQLRRDSDTVQAFLDECCIQNMKGTEKKSELYAAYCRYCHTSERQAMTRNSFYKSMRLKCYTEVKTDLGVAKGVMCYRGISLSKTAGKLPEETAKTAGDGFVDADDPDIPF